MSYGGWGKGKSKRSGHEGKGQERKRVGREAPFLLSSHCPPRSCLLYFLFPSFFNHCFLCTLLVINFARL